jgi:hypothetical protein
MSNKSPNPKKFSKQQRRFLKRYKKFSRQQDEIYGNLRRLEGNISLIDRLAEHGESIYPEEVFPLVLDFSALNKSVYRLLEYVEEEHFSDKSY